MGSMALGWQETLAGSAVLFLAFLLVKMWPAEGKRRALSAEVRAARDRAHAARTPRERALALCEAAGLAAKQGGRWTAAVGFFVRAMNSDPLWPGAVERAVEVLHRRRPRLLERILWRRLAHLPWDDAHQETLRAAAAGLRHLYGHEIKDPAKAEVLKRLSRAFDGSPRGARA